MKLLWRDDENWLYRFGNYRVKFHVELPSTDDYPLDDDRQRLTVCTAIWTDLGWQKMVDAWRVLWPDGEPHEGESIESRRKEMLDELIGAALAFIDDD